LTHADSYLMHLYAHICSMITVERTKRKRRHYRSFLPGLPLHSGMSGVNEILVYAFLSEFEQVSLILDK
jgi:hypothetical protein